MEKVYKAIVSYDGTNYCGWQIQPQDLTVEQCLKKTFFNIFKKPVKILAASRTDAGVHARGQVIRIKTDLEIEPEKLLRIYNAGLPGDVCILSLLPAEKDFNPHVNVLEKTYSYTLFLQKQDPFISRFGWEYPFSNNLDLELFEKALQIFVSSEKLNFKDFVKVEDKRDSFMRKVNQIYVEKKSLTHLKIYVKAKGFLRYQVRRIVGAALEIATRKTFDFQNIKKSLRGEDVDKKKLPTLCANAQGLCLEKIEYGKN